MIKKLLVIPFSLFMLLAIPSVGYANKAIEIIDNDFQGISITVTSSTIHVTGASGQTLYIYNVTGVLVTSLKVDGADRYYDLSLPKGCYIAKIGKTVKKISVK